MKRIEESRARSQSVPAVAKTAQSDGTTVNDIDSLLLAPSGQPIDYDEVERAEEADPERMALEQVK